MTGTVGSGAELSAKERRYLARREQIMEVALQIAAGEGWGAVTTRRLAQAIDYSQPVIYQHFASRDDLLRTIAIDGFAALSDHVETLATTHLPVSLGELCRTYLDFARSNPSRYEAMFSLPTSITFDARDTPDAPQRAFNSLRTLIARHTGQDPDTAAEFFWATCHGLASLIAAGRIPDERLDAHVANVVHLFHCPDEG